MSKWEEFSHSIDSSREYHERYHRALNNPKRREILKLLASGLSEDEIIRKLGLSRAEFDYHIQILIQGFCLERKDGMLVLTKEGNIINYL
jgi:DNA-binding transcriptional ArsR family regulator